MEKKKIGLSWLTVLWRQPIIFLVVSEHIMVRGYSRENVLLWSSKKEKATEALLSY